MAPPPTPSSPVLPILARDGVRPEGMIGAARQARLGTSPRRRTRQFLEGMAGASFELMKPASVSSVLHRVVSLHLAATALAGCGGSVTASEAAAQGPTCRVTSTTPFLTASGTGTEEEGSFAFDGTNAECVPEGGGFDCAGICPLDPSCSFLPRFDGGNDVVCDPYGARSANNCAIGEDVDGGNDLWCHYGIAANGRRPEGFELSESRRGATRAGRLLGIMAQLEAASVHAFIRLANELRAHGAPPELQARALRAARDEVRHARVMTRLAQSKGSSTGKVRAPSMHVRPLEDIAVENAVEGCVRETFGAALAMVEAETARDAAVRAAMARIAPDETRHAELAWDVGAWLDTQLSDDARARVRLARTQAAEALVKSTQSAAESACVGHGGGAHHGDDGDDLGLSSPAHAGGLARALQAWLWS